MTRSTEYARDLRRSMTDAEQPLWRCLRQRQLEGFKFRRQAPLGPYIADFICLEAKLVIEVDGGQHAEAQHRDQQRDTWMHAQGYRVLRFWNNEVFETLDGVVERIRDELRQPCTHPHPSLPPSRGKELVER